MKILHVIASLSTRYGGPSKACFEMAHAVANLGHEVSIYTTNIDGKKRANVPLYKPVTNHNVKIEYYPIQFPHFWGTSVPLLKALRRKLNCFDIAHVHSLYLFPNWAAYHECKRQGVPYIIRPHGSLDPYIYHRHRRRKKIMELLFQNSGIKNASLIHATTEEEKQIARQFTFERPYSVVPIGLNLSEYSNLPSAGKFKSKSPKIDNRTVILFLGRINFIKGLDILAKAFGKIVQIRKNTHLVIAGPDNDGYLEKVKRWLFSVNAINQTTFTGMLDGQDKLAVLRDADIFVLPSYSENFGISVVEAMACGIPVVISNKVNIWREVKASGAGLVGSCDESIFAEMMLSLIDNPEQAKKMGEKGKALVKKRFQWNLIGCELESVYKKVLSFANE